MSRIVVVSTFNSLALIDLEDMEWTNDNLANFDDDIGGMNVGKAVHFGLLKEGTTTQWNQPYQSYELIC